MTDHKIECEIEDGNMTCEWDGKSVSADEVRIPTASMVKLTAESESGWNCEKTPPNYDKVFCNAVEPGSGYGSAKLELHPEKGTETRFVSVPKEQVGSLRVETERRDDLPEPEDIKYSRTGQVYFKFPTKKQAKKFESEVK